MIWLPSKLIPSPCLSDIQLLQSHPAFAMSEVAEAVSVGLMLDNNQVAWGDCVAVEFSGKAGRDPIFRAEEGLATIQRAVAPALQGRTLTGFRELATEVDVLIESVEISRPLPPSKANRVPKELSRRDLLAAPTRLLHPEPFGRAQDRHTEGLQPTQEETERVTVERRLHTAVRYGVSQALLKAVALARGVTMAEVIAEEWGLPLPDAPVPIHAQSGGERYHNADKMIVRRVASLPHALVDNIPEQLGEDGTELTRYARCGSRYASRNWAARTIGPRFTWTSTGRWDAFSRTTWDAFWDSSTPWNRPRNPTPCEWSARSSWRAAKPRSKR
jgi:hypothetical protein